jgi:hypothetical protein
MKAQRLLAVLEKLPYGTDVEFFPNNGESYKTTIGEWLDRHDGDSDLSEYAVREENEIFFCSETGECALYTNPVFTILTE